MSDKNNFDAYIQPSYSALKSTDTNNQEDLYEELMVFLNKYTEFSRSKTHLQCLSYCFDHYVNMDPASRCLPIQEKLKRAGEMAINFLGIFSRPKA
jgi:hypothetical protein